MLISVQNILGGQLSAISGQHLEIELPLSKSESNRALMIVHYAGNQCFDDLETWRLGDSVSSISVNLRLRVTASLSFFYNNYYFLMFSQKSIF